MHEVAVNSAPVVVILVGIFMGILLNQRALDKLELRVEKRFDGVESRVDHLEARMDRRFDQVQADLDQFHRIMGQHDEAIDTLKKRP